MCWRIWRGPMATCLGEWAIVLHSRLEHLTRLPHTLLRQVQVGLAHFVASGEYTRLVAISDCIYIFWVKVLQVLTTHVYKDLLAPLINIYISTSILPPHSNNICFTFYWFKNNPFYFSMSQFAVFKLNTKRKLQTLSCSQCSNITLKESLNNLFRNNFRSSERYL